MAWEGDGVSLSLCLERLLNKAQTTSNGNIAQLWLCLCCKSIPNFIRASIAAASELFMGWFLHQQFPIGPRLFCVFFRREKRPKEGQGFVTDSKTSLWWNKCLPGPQAVGRSQKADYYFPWKTIFPAAVLVSFSFCKIHIVHNSAKMEYFKRWPLLLSSLLLGNPEGY